MKNTFRIVIATVFSLEICSASIAETVTEKVGEWVFATVYQPKEEIDPLCVLDSPKDSAGHYLRITNQVLAGVSMKKNRGNGVMTIFLPENAPTGQMEQIGKVSFSIDGLDLWEKPAEWIKLPSGLGIIRAVVVGDVDDLIKPIAQGRKIEVRFDTLAGKNIVTTLDLGGSYSALVAFEGCLSKVRIAPK